MKDTKGFGRRRAGWSSAKDWRSEISRWLRGSAERLFERGLKVGGEKLRGAVRGNDHIVFAAHAKFSGNVDSGLVGKRHARLKNGFAAAHEIRMLVAVEPESVADAVREIFVIGSVAGAGDDGARGIVDGAGEAALARRIKSGVLRFADDFVHAPHFFRRLAEDPRARYVGVVAFDFTAAVNEHDVAFLQRLRLDGAVRQGGGSSQ